jgi:NAD(P)-dependent dehydrogenase (short-subunit alcohol dehydrogenase family)
MYFMLSGRLMTSSPLADAGYTAETPRRHQPGITWGVKASEIIMVHVTPLELNPPPGTRILITGGAYGIGRAVAEAYAARGARICILDRVAVKDAPEDWMCFKGSAADADDTEAAFAAMDKAWGGVDVAHANAGISMNKPTLELTEEEWRRTLDVNLTGVFLTCQAAGRRMVPAGAGLILVTSSIYGLTAGSNRAAYTATKAGVANLVRTLAIEWGHHGVRVNAISPGYIETDMMLAQVQRGQYSLDKVKARTPMPRLGAPADIGAMAAFLGSPGAAWVNGAVIPVDGGWMANGGPE